MLKLVQCPLIAEYDIFTIEISKKISYWIVAENLVEEGRAQNGVYNYSPE